MTFIGSHRQTNPGVIGAHRQANTAAPGNTAPQHGANATALAHVATMTTLAPPTAQVTVGTGTQAPVPNPPMKSKVEKFLIKIDNTLNPTTRANNRAAELSSLPGLPPGVTISANGKVDTTIPLRVHSNAMMQNGLATVSQPTTGHEFMQAIANHKGGANATFDKVVTMTNGQQLALNGELARDFGRMEIDIPTANGLYRTSERGGVEAESKLAQTATHLRAFAGSDEAARVISSLTNQFTIRTLPRVQEGGNGEVISAKFASSRSPIEVRLPDGNKLKREDAPQLADAHFTMSRLPNNNFKVDLEWPSYVTGFQQNQGGAFSDSPVKCADGTGLRQTLRTSIEIDANQAAQGNAVIVGGTPPTITYEGKIDVSATMKAAKG